MASDKHLNCSLQRVLSFYFKSCVNRTGILQLFSIMIYLSTHLESTLIMQQNPRLGKILFSWSVTSGEKSQSKEKSWKENRSRWCRQREKKEKTGGEINAGEDMPKLVIEKERRCWEVQSQMEGNLERKQDWLFEPSENVQGVIQPYKRGREQMTIWLQKGSW